MENEIRAGVLSRYDLEYTQLHYLFEKVSELLVQKGFSIHFKNLESIVETDIYHINRELDTKDEHHETCLSDGKNIWLHDDIEDSGGIEGRLYDILHVGFGHAWQWAASSDSGFKFFGQSAWNMATEFYLFKPEDQIQLVRVYEEEAANISYMNLKTILNLEGFTSSFRDNYINFYIDYCRTDLEYITNYYRTGLVKCFYENWLFNAPKFQQLNVDIPLQISSRESKCISLIKS